MEKISIITVSYNCSRFIGQALESVVGQDHKALDYILVDGGSTDGTVDIIKKYADCDGRIRWVSEPDGGIADAMNKGIAMADGDVVGHLHADDYYPHCDVLSAVSAAFAANPQALWLTGGASLVDGEGRVLTEIRGRRYSFRKLRRVNFIIHPSTFIRRSAFAKVGKFDTFRKYAMDYDLWLRLGALADPLHLNRTLACFRIHDASLSMSQSAEAFAEEYDVRRRLLAGNGLGLCVNFLHYEVMKRLNCYTVKKLRSRS